MIKQFNANRARMRRHQRVRRHLAGTSSRPRLNVFRSGQHIYAQIIDDVTGMTLVAASSLDESLQDFKPAQPAASAASLKEISVQVAEEACCSSCQARTCQREGVQGRES